MSFLFKSELTKKIFAYYFTNPEVSHYVRELARILKTDPTNLSRELAALEKQGIFVSRLEGKQRHYRLNKINPLFKELKSIVLKTYGAAGSLKVLLNKLNGVDLAILYGSFAAGEEDQASDIDILIVGDIGPEQISEAIGELEDKLQREINVKTYSPDEFLKNKRKGDPFLKSVFASKYIVLVERYENNQVSKDKF